jgi:hypothetical protein
MKKTASLLFLLLGLFNINAQTATNIASLQTPFLDETSGLIFYNNSLVTHNDSGGAAHLYEINTTTGAVTRTVVVNNATNVDWEDIAQDPSYFYVGDIGNNSGTRTNLKVYKISKADYNDTNDVVTAEVISYSYANQTDFTPNINNNNWDAEGLISYGDKLLIFSKNWVTNTVDVYSIPKTAGTHSAILESTFDTNGLITGADSSTDGTVIFLTGYSNSAAPFMFTIHNIPSSTLDLFSGTVSAKIPNIVPLGNQVEGITLFEITATKHRLYISNEKYIVSLGPITLAFPAKLWTIEIDNDAIALNMPSTIPDSDIRLYLNPYDGILNLSKHVDEITIYDVSGRNIAKHYLVNKVSLENLQQGVYIAHLKINNATLIRKLMKK